MLNGVECGWLNGIYALTTNKSPNIQVNSHTEEDLLALKKREFPEKSKEVQSCDFYIAALRVLVHKWNCEKLNSMKSEAFTIPAIHINPLQKDFTPFIDEKDGVVGNTGFLDQLVLKIGAPIVVINNINTSDGITNGTPGTLFEVKRNAKKEIVYLVIDLANPSKGRSNTAANSTITKGVPGRIVLEKVRWDYPLRKKGGGRGEATATVIQFPVRLGFASSCHKFQGQTIAPPGKVAVNLQKLLRDPSALVYVSLSRAKELKQIHIVGSLKKESIRCSAEALLELKRLHKISMNSNPSPWWSQDDSIKIATLNCRGLMAHINDINHDHFLKQATVVNLLETSLNQGQQGPVTMLTDFTSNFYSVGKGKGIASFVKASHNDITPSGESIRGLCQIVKLSSLDLDIFAVYKSKKHSSAQMLWSMTPLIDPGKATFIAGDFNIDSSTDKSLARELTAMGFHSVVNAATHVAGGHIDHGYFRDPEEVWQLTVERFSPYYTDHDLLAAVLKKKNTE